MNNQRQSELLKAAADAFGFSTVTEMLEAVNTDSIVPAICSDCGYTTKTEPDVVNYSCSVCGDETISSVLVIAGIVFTAEAPH